MIKGRRTRHAGKSSTSNSAKPNVDDTASPKRKDSKSNNKTSSVAAVQLNKKHVPHAREPIMLRGGRLKNADISCYLHPTDRSKTGTAVGHPNSESIIDIRDENSCEAIQPQSSESLDIHLPTVSSCGRNKQDGDTVPASRKTNNYNNNNIFLQEPVLSLNLDKTPTEATRTLKIMQKPFLANSNLKNSLFSSLSQPKIDSLWNNTSMTTMCNSSSLIPQNVLLKTLEQHALDLSKPTQVTHIDSTTATAEMLLHTDDSNSCDSGDSGVVVLSSTSGTSTLANQETESNLVVVRNNTDSAEKRKKPATPHRILCPSPIKHVVISSSNLEGEAKSSNTAYNKKSQAVPNKTRKRLNVHDADTQIPDPPLNDINHRERQYATTEEHRIDDEINVTRGNKLTGKQHELTVEPLYAKANTVGNKKITEFYPVRRSVRKTKKEVQVERDRDIEHAIQEEREEGLKIQHFEGKGRGIVTTRPFCKGEFVVEYIGDLISVSEAKLREQMYAEDDNTGCYMYYFKHKNLQHCIDATAESGKLGRLVNHSRNGNLVTKTVSLHNRPHLVLIAKEDIDAGVEVTYDYGDRSKEALQYYPWLAL